MAEWLESAFHIVMIISAIFGMVWQLCPAVMRCVERRREKRHADYAALPDDPV